MIRGWIAGFSRPSKETRHGDAQVLIDDKNKICFIIDGGCDESGHMYRTFKFCSHSNGVVIGYQSS